MSSVAVLGAGSWGTALALVLCDNDHQVTLWTHKTEQKARLEKEKENKQYLPNVSLPDSLRISDNLKESVEHADAIVLVVPTKAIRDVSKQLKSVLQQPTLIIHASKGIEPDTHLRISEMIRDELDENQIDEIVVLSGPSHAEEVGMRHPTTITAAAEKKEAAEQTQSLFMNNYFRVYTSNDVIGVELGGALKNIIALGAGISDGLNYGDNAKAALITRGLAEITRLATHLGANPLTFIGLSGVGDLIVTCTSVHSRNWRAGNLFGKGRKIDEVQKELGMVAEGIRTTKAVFQLSEKIQERMPLTHAIHAVIFDGKDPKEVVDNLMQRAPTNEMDDISQMLETRYMD